MAVTLADAYLLRLRVDPDQLHKDVDKGVQGMDKSGRKAGQDFSKGFNQGAAGARTGLAGLAGDVTGLGDAFNAADRKRSVFLRGLAGLNIATGIGEAAVSALVVTVGALGAGLTAVAAGAGAYGAAVVPALGAVSDAMKAQQKVQQAQVTAEAAYQAALAAGTPKKTAEAAKTRAITAAQKQYKILLDQMPPAQRGFTESLTSTKTAYEAWGKSLAGTTLTPLITGLDLARPAMKAITPLVKASAGAFRVLTDELARKVDTGGLTRFVTTILPYVRPLTLDLGHAVANIAAGLYGILRAFLPFSTDITGALVKLTAKFKEWGSTLSGRSGFQAVLDQWRHNWPLVRQGLGDFLVIIKNIVSNLAGMATGANSRALWQVANPLLALAARLSASPELVQAFLYLYLIGRGAGQIKGVFDSLKTGWNAFAGIISALTGGKISLGMQAAGDTMLVASRNMQRAADTMAGASGIAGKGPGGAAGKAGKAGGVLSLVGGAVGAAILAGVAAGAAVNWLSTRAAPKGTPAGAAAKAIQTTGPGEAQPAVGGIAGILARLAGLRGAPGPPPKAGVFTGPGGVPVFADPKAIAKSVTAVQELNRAFGGTKATAAQAAQGIAAYATKVSELGATDQRTMTARSELIDSLTKSGVSSKTATRDVDRLTTAIARHGDTSDQARAARRRLIGDIEQAFKDSRTGRRDMDSLREAIRQHGATSDSARGARRRLIGDLVASGVDADTARGLVNRFSRAVQAIPGGKHVTIDVNGMGRFTIAQVKSLSRPGGKLAGPLAAGGRIPGFGGGDRWHALLESGEAVVDKWTTAAHAAELRAWGVPGMQAGGVVDRFRGTPAGLGRWSSAEVDRTTSMLVRATGEALQAAVKKAMQKAALTLPGPGGFAPAGLGASARSAMAYARALFPFYGWGASQWPPLQALWMGESGWRWDAYNQSSGATGIPQALPGSKMAAAGADWRTNYRTQIRWGEGYIRDIYGTPANAYSLWLSRSPHWYGKGGQVPEAIAGLGLRTGQAYGFHAGEQVTPGADMKALESAVKVMHRDVVKALQGIPARTGAGVADALARGGRRAAYSGMYGG